MVVPVPWEQLAEPVDRVALGHAIDHVAEPGLRIEAIEFGALQHGTEGSGALAAGFVGREPRRACKDTLFTGSPAPSMRCNAAVASVSCPALVRRVASSSSAGREKFMLMAFRVGP